jgi:hypothetical protein
MLSHWSECRVRSCIEEAAFGRRSDAAGAAVNSRDTEEAGQARLLDVVNPVVPDWRSIIAGALCREGMPSSRAKRPATLSVAVAEAAVAMCALHAGHVLKGTTAA